MVRGSRQAVDARPSVSVIVPSLVRGIEPVYIRRTILSEGLDRSRHLQDEPFRFSSTYSDS